MINKTIIGLIILLSLGINQSVAQNSDRFVKVGDTTVNLRDVDLEKGLVFHSEITESYDKKKNLTSFDSQEILIKSPNYECYAIVSNTLKVSSSNEGEPSSKIILYNNKNTILFEKSFNDLYVHNCYISSSSKCVIIELINIDKNEIQLYSSNGELIKTFNNNDELLYISPKHSFFVIPREIEDEIIYEQINELGVIKKLKFPSGHVKSINFSVSENYYIVFIDNEQLLYDINNNLLWKRPIKYGIINILPDDKYYIINNLDKGVLEVKKLLTHELKYTIQSVYYNQKEFPVFRYFFYDNYLYTIGRSNGIYIYNFYNTLGKLLQVEAVSDKTPFFKYEITNHSGVFILNSMDITN